MATDVSGAPIYFRALDELTHDLARLRAERRRLNLALARAPQGRAGSTPARLPRPGGKGAGFDSPAVHLGAAVSGETNGTGGPPVNVLVETSTGAP